MPLLSRVHHIFLWFGPLLCACVFLSSLRKRAVEGRFQKPKQATPAPEVHEDYGVVEVGQKCTEGCFEGWDTVPLPSPAPAFDTMGMGELLDAWPPLAAFSSAESHREERDFAAAAEFSQALGAMMTPTPMTSTVMTPESMTPAVMTPESMTPAVMTPANITAAVMTPDSPTPVNLTPATANPTRFGCRTRPTAFVFDARTEKARSAAAPTTMPRSTGRPPLSYDGNGSYNDSDGGAEGGGPLGATPPGTALPFAGKFLEKRADSGDIEGESSIDSVAKMAETYLLAGPDEETYRGYEETVAAGTFLETTLAMLQPQQTALQQQETFVFGTGL